MGTHIDWRSPCVCGGGDADHASSLSPDIRYEKPVFLISGRFRLRPKAKCQAWFDTSAFKVAAIWGLLRTSQLLSRNSSVTALMSSMTTRRHGSCLPRWVMATTTYHIYICYNWRLARTPPAGLVLYTTCVKPVMSGVTQVLRHWRHSRCIFCFCTNQTQMLPTYDRLKMTCLS
jgi:hypothetical protein